MERVEINNPEDAKEAEQEGVNQAEGDNEAKNQEGFGNYPTDQVSRPTLRPGPTDRGTKVTISFTTYISLWTLHSFLKNFFKKGARLLGRHFHMTRLWLVDQ